MDPAVIEDLPSPLNQRTRAVHLATAQPVLIPDRWVMRKPYQLIVHLDLRSQLRRASPPVNFGC